MITRQLLNIRNDMPKVKMNIFEKCYYYNREQTKTEYKNNALLRFTIVGISGIFGFIVGILI